MTDRHGSGPDTPPPAGTVLDDEAIGGLVREVAGGWVMPPRRIDEQTWRDRVTQRAAARAGRQWRRRLAAAAGLAVAASVLLAVGAVWLNDAGRLPSTGSDASASPSSAATPGATGPGPSPAALPSPAPTMAVFGDPLPVSSIVLTDFHHRLLDLTTGRLGPAMESDRTGASSILRHAGGGWTCVCVTLDRPMWPEASAMSIDLVEYDASGALTGSRFLGAYTDAVPDPVSGMVRAVGATASPAERPDRIYLGWVVRGRDGWQSGVDVVDLAAARVIQKMRLPDLPLEERIDAAGDPFQTQVDPPIVTVSPDGGRMVITRNAYVIKRDPVTGIDFVSRSGWWGAPVTAGAVGPLAALASGEGTLDPVACPVVGEPSFAGADVFVFRCSSDVLRRIDPRDGRPLGDVRIDGVGDSPSWVAAGADGRRYLWFPLARTLVEVDAVGGTVLRRTTIDGVTGLVDPGTADPLGALADLGRRVGRWIAPPVQAKIMIQPAIVLSPDGSRLYLLGVEGDSPDRLTATTGVHVVDTASLTEVATWAPTADWVSIAVSGDGTLVYLVGAPGMAVDATGGTVEDPGRPASLTVLDAATGEPRAIAGRLDVEFAILDPSLTP